MIRAVQIYICIYIQKKYYIIKNFKGSSNIGCLIEFFVNLSVGLVPLPPKIFPYSVGPT